MITRTAFARSTHDESGAALVGVVVVMFLGVVIAATIAASVIFTVTSNVDNKSRTQAFIAAESGRDTAVASLAGAINASGDLVCANVALTDSGTSPIFSYAIKSTASTTQPTGWGDSGLSAVCPSPNSTKFVVIRSTGTGPKGDTTTIDTVYPWRTTHVTQPAGTMAYFDGEFKATKSTYTGDLVIRGTDPYTCNNSSTIYGDLWVVKSSVILSTGCTIKGSVYAFGTVTSSSSGINVTGDIIAGGAIDLTADESVIGGKIQAGGAVTLKGTGSTSGTVGGTVTGTTMPTISAKWTLPGGGVLTGTAAAFDPNTAFQPTLIDVFNVTQWLELTSSGIWGTPTSTPKTTTYATCDIGEIRAAMADTSTNSRALFDMSACLNSNDKDVDIALSGTAITLARDAIFYVPATKGMNLSISTPISASGDPQLMIVHADSNSADASPTLCAKGLDSLSISANVAPRLMIYSPCGLNGNVGVSFSGQLYTANSGNHLVLASFECKPMGWLPAFGQLSCGIKGEGGALDTSKDVVSLDPRVYQTEL